MIDRAGRHSPSGSSVLSQASKKKGRAKVDFARPLECQAGLERESAHQRAGALTDNSAGERRNDSAETAAQQALVGPEENVVGRDVKLPRLIPPAAPAAVGNCRRLKMLVNSTRMLRS